MIKTMDKEIYHVIGAMSGTSLDGLDLAAVEFSLKKQNWNFKLQNAVTISYSNTWEERLKSAPLLSGEELILLHLDYGNYIGEQIKLFIAATGFAPDFIASHGHTVFHQPHKKLTVQVGSGEAIAKKINLPSISDFRIGDVLLGGQGAPLVPIGDRLLFADYDYCLNLGGFANISFEKNNRRVAFDICPVNIVLNEFAKRFGLKYDKNGEKGSAGKLDPELLAKLNSLNYYKQKAPKSLGREWVKENIDPIFDHSKQSDQDKMRTFYEHIAVQIAASVSEKGKMLLTGGGTFNSFLIDKIREHSSVQLILPDAKIIEYKEALIFAFLGLLRWKGINNCLSSVSGAERDSCAGVIYFP